MAELDAWQQHDDLVKKFTRKWEVRPDLKVTACAHARHVELGVGLGTSHVKLPGLEQTHYTQRNVTTMRELANVLLAACDFVEAQNPTWSTQVGPEHPAENFEVIEGEQSPPSALSRAAQLFE